MNRKMRLGMLTLVVGVMLCVVWYVLARQTGELGGIEGARKTPDFIRSNYAVSYYFGELLGWRDPIPVSEWGTAASATKYHEIWRDIKIFGCGSLAVALYGLWLLTTAYLDERKRAE